MSGLVPRSIRWVGGQEIKSAFLQYYEHLVITFVSIAAIPSGRGKEVPSRIDGFGVRRAPVMTCCRAMVGSGGPWLTCHGKFKPIPLF